MLIKSLLLAPILLILTACTSQPMTQSGFLSDYQALQKNNQDKEEETYLNPNAAFSQYDSVIIAPVELKITDSDPDDAVSHKELANGLNKNLQQQFGKYYRIARQQAPGTFYVRTAITGITTANP